MRDFRLCLLSLRRQTLYTGVLILLGLFWASTPARAQFGFTHKFDLQGGGQISAVRRRRAHGRRLFGSRGLCHRSVIESGLAVFQLSCRGGK